MVGFFSTWITYSVTLLWAANFFLSRVERLSPVPIKKRRQGSVSKILLTPLTTRFFFMQLITWLQQDAPSLSSSLEISQYHPSLPPSESLTFYISLLTTTLQKIVLQREITLFQVERRSKRLYRSGICTLYLLLLALLIPFYRQLISKRSFMSLLNVLSRLTLGRIH